MVAITVILAAVIGTFVLGLGDSLGDSQPTAQLSISGEESDEDNDVAGTITIEHTGGDTINAENIDIAVRNGSETIDRDRLSDVFGDDDARISVGDSVSVDLADSTNGDTTIDGVRLIHTPSQSIIADQTIDDITEVDDGGDGDAFADSE